MRKLWKVWLHIVTSNFEGTEQTGSREEIKFFENFDQAKKCALYGDGIKFDYHVDFIAHRKIYEYEISAVRELAEKQRPVEVVKKTETYWD